MNISNDISRLIVKYLRDELSPGETTALNNWLNESEAHRSLLASLDNPDTMQAFLEKMDSIDLDAGWKKLLQKIGDTGEGNDEIIFKGWFLKHRRRMVWHISYAASFFLIILLTWWIFNNNHPMGNEAFNPGMVLTTNNGERKTFVLEDGSRVMLNGGSRLVLAKNFGSDNRRVQLDGEAFFDIAKGLKHAFIIHTATMDIKDISTTFNVRAYTGEKKDIVLLVNGKIALDIKLPNKETRSVVLAPQQKITVVRDPRVSMSKPAEVLGIFMDSLMGTTEGNDLPEIAWTEDRLVFHEQELSDIAFRLEKWFNVRVIFESASLKSLRFSGSFYKESLRQIMDVVHYSNPAVGYRLSDSNKMLVLYETALK